MTVYDAVHALVGFPHLVAFRLPGPQLTLSRYNMVIDHQGPKPRRYVPSFGDLVSIDWQVAKKEDFMKLLTRMLEDAQARRAALEEREAAELLEEQR
jgi:hypothetical protein